MANVLTRIISRAACGRLVKREFSILSYYHYPCITRLNKRINDYSFSCDHYNLTFRINPQKYRICNYSDKGGEKPPEKLTLFQKFKQMYRDYWYILVPVHLVTSSIWFGGFYYMAKSGIDIVHILESWHVSEKVLNPLRDSSMGYLAVAYACYKIATPARYTVTLGGTTISINYLKKWGYIKPVPSAERMKEIYQEKKENITKTVREGIKEKKETFMDSFHETTEGIKEKKDNLLKTVKKSADIKKTEFKKKT
uniref:Uncharacterized protein C18orf19 homolog A-like n=1 Tax=Diabrotica virgifera virgifera TaxID=50390 RepID=A0A6P7HGZ0_DIAVI